MADNCRGASDPARASVFCPAGRASAVGSLFLPFGDPLRRAVGAFLYKIYELFQKPLPFLEKI